MRLWGIGQGYPDFYGHVDEVGVAASIWNFFRSRTLLPTEFTYPAFYSYLVAAVLWVSGWLAPVPRADGLVDALVLRSFLDPGWAALAGRGLSAVLSTLSILFTYRLGREAFNQRVGLVAAMFVSAAAGPVAQAHRALPDTTMAFLAVVCFYFSWKVYQRGTWLDYVGAGVAAGLVVATKYNGAFTALALVAGHVLRSVVLKRSVRAGILSPRLWGGVVLAFVALFAGSPYLFLAHEKYLALASYQVSSLGFALRQTSPWWWILKGLVEGESVLGVAMIAGVGWALVRRHPLDWLFLAAWVPSFLYIGTWTRESLHYLLHFYPLLALGAARVLETLVHRVARVSSAGWQVWALAGLCIVPSVHQVVEHNRLLDRPDTRALAGAWIEENLPEGAKVAMTWLPYGPRLALFAAHQSVKQYYRGRPAVQAYLEDVWSGKPAYRLVNLEYWSKQPVVPEAYRQRVDLGDPETQRIFRRHWHSVPWLRSAGVEYIVLPEAVYGRYLDIQFPEEGTAAHYHYLKNHTYFKYLTAPENPEIELVASFPSGSGVRGSGIHIFHLRP